MRRKILAFTGTRADYGIQHPVYQALQAQKTIDLKLVVCGMHMSEDFGYTAEIVRKDGFKIAAYIDTLPKSDSLGAMAEYVGESIKAFVPVIQKEKPDLVLVLGDRGEMLAAAVAATYLSVPVAHLHGGEESGTADDAVRHVITQLSSVHLTSAKVHSNRVRLMRGKKTQIHTVGAPALDVIKTFTPVSKSALLKKEGFDLKKKTVVLVQHPDPLSSVSATEQIGRTLTAISSLDVNLLVIGANSDAGGRLFNKTLESFVKNREHGTMKMTVPHREFLSWLNAADLLLGNSSSGIIEAASFGLPVVNIGNRQRGRLRSGNVIDVPMDTQAITKAVQKILKQKPKPVRNLYGDGKASKRIVKILSSVPLSADLR